MYTQVHPPHRCILLQTNDSRRSLGADTPAAHTTQPPAPLAAGETTQRFKQTTATTYTIGPPPRRPDLLPLEPLHETNTTTSHRQIGHSLAVFVGAALPAVRLPLGDVLERDEDLAVVIGVALQPVQQPRLQGVLVRVVLRARGIA